MRWKKAFTGNFDATRFFLSRWEPSFTWSWSCYSPLGSRRREFVWKWPEVRMERDGENQNYDFMTRVIKSNWVWITELFDYMKCLLHSFCVACNYNRVLTDYSILNNFVKLCFLLNVDDFQPVASGPIWTHWPTGMIHLSFHLFFNIYFGTTQMVKTIYYVYLSLYSLQRFVQVLYQITLPSHKETVRE